MEAKRKKDEEEAMRNWLQEEEQAQQKNQKFHCPKKSFGE